MIESNILEVEYIDRNSPPIKITVVDGTVYTIGNNVKSFYEKLISLPCSHRLAILQLNIEETEKFILESRKILNEKLIAEFKKKWVWRIDDDHVCDFNDLDENEDYFGFRLRKIEIINRIKKNKFSASEVISMLNFFKDNNDIKLKE